MNRSWPLVDFIVCPIEYRQAILQSLPTTLSSNRRFYSKEQLLKGAYFSYDERAIIFLMDKFEYSYQIAKQRLDSMYFLPQMTIGEPRVDELIKLYQTLDENNLLIKQKYFAASITGKTAFVIGYDHDEELVNTADYLGIKLLYEQAHNRQLPSVIIFDTLKEEIYDIFNQIAKLIDQGIAPSDIAIISPDSEATLDLKIASYGFGIMVNHLHNDLIGHSEVVIKTIDYLKKSRDFNRTREYSISAYTLETEHPLIRLFDELVTLEARLDTKIAYFSQRARQLTINQGHYPDGINLSSNLYPCPSKHIFVIGVSQGMVPFIHRDTDFLSDREKVLLGRSTSSMLNKIEAARWEKFILNQENLVISLHKYGYAGEKFPSPLLAKLGLTPQTPPLLEVDYGQTLAKVKAALLNDRHRIYQIDHPQLASYRPTIEMEYQSYDYHYQPFDFGLGDKSLQLSYTAIKTFYQCRFRYYLQYLVKLSDDSDNFYTKFGEFAHELLERAYGPEFEFETAYNEIYAKSTFTPKEEVLMIRLKQDLFEVINFNHEHEANMKLSSMLHELSIKFRIDDKTSFKGKIDKVLVTQDDVGNKYLAVVDYKTGNEDFDARKLPYGHSMQLPTYALLLSQDPNYAGIEVIGYYIQNIIAAKLVRPIGKDPSDFYREQLRLSGLSTSDMTKLATLDQNYEQSQFIRTIATTKNGDLKKSAKVADAATFERYRDLTMNKVTEALGEIREHRFDIDPKRFSTTDHSCHYCQFRDICFRNDKAYIDITIANEEDADESPAE